MRLRPVQRDKSQYGEEHSICKYRLQHDSSKVIMIADCKECGGKANMNDKRCLKGILNGLCQEYNIDSVILSHFIETKYADDSMQMLMMMVEIVHYLEQMSIREPFEEYFANEPRLSSSSKSRQKGTCERCALRPERAFIGLKKHFLGDISCFYNELKNLSEQLEANKIEACAECIKVSESDITYLFEKLEDFRAFVIYKAFQIVI